MVPIRCTSRTESQRAKCPANPQLANTLFAMLTSEDKVILDFERAWWKEPGPKDQAIELALGLSAAVFYERLRKLALSPAALAYDPLTVKRVRSLIWERTDAEMAV